LKFPTEDEKKDTGWLSTGCLAVKLFKSRQPQYEDGMVVDKEEAFQYRYVCHYDNKCSKQQQQKKKHAMMLTDRHHDVDLVQFRQ